MTLFAQSHIKRAAYHAGLQIKTIAHLLWIEFCHMLGKGVVYKVKFHHLG